MIMGAFNAEEAFDLFWTEFDKSLVSGGKASAKGHKGDALKTYKRIVTGAKKAGEVISGFRAKKRELMQLKNNNQFAASLPTVDRYLKKKMWEIETDNPDRSVNRQVKELAICSEPNCNYHVYSENFLECANHLNPVKRKEEKAQLIDWMKDNKLMKLKTESEADWKARMRQSARDGFREMLGSKVKEI